MYTQPAQLVSGRLAGLLFVACGALSALTLPLPQAPGVEHLAVLVVSLVAVAVGAIAFLAPWQRWHPRATLALVPVAFALISAGNYYGNAQPYTYSVFFIVAFVWVGLTQPRWTSAFVVAPATAAYLAPILLHPRSFIGGPTSVFIVIPVCAAVAEAIAWTSTRERQSRVRTAALARVALALGPHLDVEELSQTLADETKTIMRAERAVFFLLRDGSIHKVYGAGFRPEILARLQGVEGVEVGDRPGFDELRAGRPVLVEDASHDPKLLRDPTRFGLKSYMAVPVLVGDELAGILSCAERTRARRYHRDDVISAQALAAQASSALNNALLYERTLDAARNDPLTQLENRRVFHERLETEIERAARHNRELSLMIIDVDHLKEINDAWGHAAGDRVLESVANVLRDGSRREDGVYRIGGDEFALILPETDLNGATNLAERLRVGVHRERVNADGRHLTISAGVGSFPDHGMNADELFERADNALYEVKRVGRNAVSAAVTAEPAGPGVRFGLDVSMIIRGKRLVARYQPVVHLGARKVIGYECYCRLDPMYGTVPTTTLFRAAGALGLTEALDRQCRERVLDGLADLDLHQVVFINVSSVALSSEDFDASELIESITRHGLRPDQIVVEVTGHERGPAPVFLANLDACRAAGMSVSLDDFGCAMSDLEVATSFSFDYVKVDVGFVRGGSELRRQLLRGLLVVAHEVGAKSIAKGVESKDDLDLVRHLGFAGAQGYFLKDPSPVPSPPVDLDELYASVDR